MKNQFKLVSILELILLIILIISIIFQRNLFQKYKKSELKESKSTNTITDDKSLYTNLENLQTVLNQKTSIADFQIEENWTSFGMAADPLYEIKSEYPYSTTATSGEIVAVSKYIQGKYIIENKGEIGIQILQDKTFENGGFIYINNNDRSYIQAYYKYKKCYIVCSSYNEKIELSDIYNFIHEIVDIISKNYTETNEKY